MGMASHSGGSIINLIINCDLSLLRCFSLDVCSCFPEKSSFALFAAWREILTQKIFSRWVFFSRKGVETAKSNRGALFLASLASLREVFKRLCCEGAKG